MGSQFSQICWEIMGLLKNWGKYWCQDRSSPLKGFLSIIGRCVITYQLGTPAVVVVYLLTPCALLDVLEVRYLSPLSNTRQQSWVKLLSAETLARVAS